VCQQVLDLTMHELTTLRELVAGTVGEVLPDAAGFRLAGAAGEIAVLDEVGEPRIRGLCVQLDALEADWSDKKPLMPAVNNRMIAR
jgi:hypothetical protein